MKLASAMLAACLLAGFLACPLSAGISSGGGQYICTLDVCSDHSSVQTTDMPGLTEAPQSLSSPMQFTYRIIPKDSYYPGFYPTAEDKPPKA